MTDERRRELERAKADQKLAGAASLRALDKYLKKIGAGSRTEWNEARMEWCEAEDEARRAAQKAAKLERETEQK